MSKHNYTKYSNNNLRPSPVENQNGVQKVEETAIEAPVAELKQACVVNCNKLRVRENPSVEAEVLCELPVNTELLVIEELSTPDFYKVFTASGLEGFCMRNYIKVDK